MPAFFSSCASSLLPFLLLSYMAQSICHYNTFQEEIEAQISHEGMNAVDGYDA